MYFVQSLHIYPVKSARGLEVKSSGLDRFGLEGDRRWMLTDSEGRFVTQRELPELTELQVDVSPAGLVLKRGNADIAVPIPETSARVPVTVWEDTVSAADAGDAAAGWLATVFQRPLRLVYMPDDSRRAVDPDYAKDGETVSFADGFPLLLVSAASAVYLNQRLAQPVGLDRFRPNIVVAGCPAHAEDQWQRLRIGEMVFTVAKSCSRCVVPSLDQNTGARHPELLRVLADYRRGPGRKVYFGQNLVYQGSGHLRVGDAVEVLG